MEPLLLAGRWVETGKVRPVINPYQGERVFDVCQAGPEDFERAIAAAEGAFPAARMMPAYRRSRILAGIAAALAARVQDFAELITRETGKPIMFSQTEVERAIFTFTTASEEAKRMEGVILPLDMASSATGRQALVQRFPVGPVAAITPFNFPLNLVAHKMAPALAVGCPFVLKPSSNAPVTALRLGQVALEAGVPEEMLSILPCASNEAAQLIEDERIKLISFTGSPAVGWPLKVKAGKKKVTLELGGNAAVIIHSDAQVDHAVKRVVVGAFGNAGQSCISTQRLYVHESRLKEVTDTLLAAVRALATGNPENPATVVGPMITEEAAVKAESWVTEAEKDGARVLLRGARRGALLHPIVLTGVNPAQKVSCQEVFAPVLEIEPYRDIADAFRCVNASSYGLQAGIFTNDAAIIFRAYRELEVGGVVVNDSSAFRMDHMPYGGIKDSGFGREGLRYAMEEMTEPKLLALNFPS
ncbi:MAG TPA: aldehyde dehydrogenase family protein [Bacteroidota bacterium]